MVISPKTVEVPGWIIQEFQKRAKKSFPNETFAYILGSTTDDITTMTELYVPDDVDKHCRPDCVWVQDYWERNVKKYARKHDLSVVAEIHSHPYSRSELKNRIPHMPDLSPSQGDWERTPLGYLMGICLVTETKDHKLRTKTKFWGPLVPVKVKAI